MEDQVREVVVAPRRTDELMLTWLQGHLEWASPEFQRWYGLAHVHIKGSLIIKKGYYYCDRRGQWMIASCKKDAVSKIRKGLVRRTAPRSLLQECSLQMRAHALRERRARRSCVLRPDAQGCQQLPTTPCVQWLRASRTADELHHGHAVATMPFASAVPMAMPNSIAPNLSDNTTLAPLGLPAPALLEPVGASVGAGAEGLLANANNAIPAGAAHQAMAAHDSAVPSVVPWSYSVQYCTVHQTCSAPGLLLGRPFKRPCLLFNRLRQRKRRPRLRLLRIFSYNSMRMQC